MAQEETQADSDQEKMDKVLKRMLKTPPKPHTPKKDEKPKKAG